MGAEMGSHRMAGEAAGICGAGGIMDAGGAVGIIDGSGATATGEVTRAVLAVESGSSWSFDRRRREISRVSGIDATAGRTPRLRMSDGREKIRLIRSVRSTDGDDDDDAKSSKASCCTSVPARAQA